MIKTVQILCILFFFQGCTHKSVDNEIPSEFIPFYTAVQKKVKPVWEETATQKFKTLNQEERSGVSKKKYYPIYIEVTELADGRVENAKMKIPGEFKSVDDIGVETFRKVQSLPPPPEKMLRDGKAIFEWKFLLQN